MTMPAYEDLLVAREAGVATVTLNRPDAMNAVDMGLKGNLAKVVAQLAGAVHELAGSLAAAPTVAIGPAKRMLEQSLQSTPNFLGR